MSVKNDDLLKYCKLNFTQIFISICTVIVVLVVNVFFRVLQILFIMSDYSVKSVSFCAQNLNN